jgi:RHS repeat-associated protein
MPPRYYAASYSLTFLLAAGCSLTNCLRADAGAGFTYPFLTSKERDNETGLDYFLARYYSNTQERFTLPDPLSSSGKPLQPQSWNLYTYCINNPVIFIDPKGLDWGYYDLGNGSTSLVWFEGKVGKYKGRQYSKFTPAKDGTVVPLAGGGAARIYRDGNREYTGGPAQVTSIPGEDSRNLGAGLVSGAVSAVNSVKSCRSSCNGIRS